MANWTITASTTGVTVPSAGEGELTFQVTNRGDAFASATIDVLLSEAASGSWFTVAHPHRWIAAGSTDSFTLTIAVPAHAMVGTHWVQGRVHTTDQGIAGGSAVSQRVSVTIVSTPVVMVSVPGVVGLGMFEAMQQITAADLRMELVGNAEQGWFDPAGGNVFPAGDWHVESQHPVPPATVSAGTTVTLYLRNRAAVEPSVVGPEVKIKFPYPWQEQPFPLP